MVRAVSERAAIACDRGESLLAATVVWGGGGAARDPGVPLAPAERTHYERDLAATRSELAEETFHAAWDTGRALSLERIIDEAESLGDD